MLPSRARIHHLTRDTGFLWRACSGVILAGVIVAAAVHALRVHRLPPSVIDVDEHVSRLFLITRAYHDELLQTEKPDPAKVAEWLRDIGESAGDLSDRFNAEKLSVGTISIRDVITRHLSDEESRNLFADYVRCLLLREREAGRQESRERIHQTAARRPALRFASEFEGDLLTEEGKRAEALQAYLREGSVADARYDRARAAGLAIALEDSRTAKTICEDARYLRETPAAHLSELARLCGDRMLLCSSLLRMQLQRFSHRAVLLLALFAAAIWFFVLVYSSAASRAQWLRYVAPVVAGVMSVWLLALWRGLAPYGFNEEQKAASMGHELFHWIMYVGVPEEAVKLALFLPLLPVLLRARSTQDAALTGGCVGLGFALNENLDYYTGHLREAGGATVAITRLITANFLHIALTGIAGAWLYGMLRSRFHRAGEFIAVFGCVAAAHGLYDFAAAGGYSSEWGFEILGIIILAAVSRFFFDLLKPDDQELRRRVVSCTSVFCIGVSLLTAVVMVASVWRMDSLSGVPGVLRSLVGVLPVGLIYVREFREA